MTKTFVRAAGLVAALLSSIDARADDSNVCKDSYEHAQEQMAPNQETSRLLLARESLRTCIRSSCKDWMVSDCSKWLGEVESRIPTIVFSARSSDGHDLVKTRVTSADGVALADALDGRALELEPGAHDFVFIAEDGRRLEKRAIVREGEKSQVIAVVFETSRDPGPVSPPPPRPPGDPSPGPPPPTLRYAGFGLAGLGLVGIGLGTVFGLDAISQKNDLDCDPSRACDKASLDDAWASANVATGSFIVGGALLAGGLALVLLAPKGTRVEPHARLERIGIGARW